MAGSKKYQLCNGLPMEYGEVYVDKNKDTIQKEVKTLSDGLKVNCPTFEDLKDACHRKIQELGRVELKIKGVLKSMWAESARSDRSKEECPVNNSSVPPLPTSTPVTPANQN